MVYIKIGLISLFIIFFCFFVPFRMVCLHPLLSVYYVITDVFFYFYHKKYNNFPSGKFNAYDSSSGVVFGSGKTLSCVHQVLQDYKKYNNKLVWDSKKKKFVVQELHILSNISFSQIPYEKLVNLGQIVKLCEKYKYLEASEEELEEVPGVEPGEAADDVPEDAAEDVPGEAPEEELEEQLDEFEKKHCILVIIDECQNQLHCRSFKDNISPMMLKQLTECRHFNMSIYYDSPRFNQVDALLRQCTSLNIKCRKLWRIQVQKVYDAQSVDNASNDIEKLKPLKRTAFFIRDDLFNAYDSYEVVNNLIKAKDRNDILSDAEILTLQQNSDNIVNFNVPKKLKIKGVKK